MQKNLDQWELRKRELFGKRLSDLREEWKSEPLTEKEKIILSNIKGEQDWTMEKKTDEMFAALIDTHRNTVSKWINGDIKPPSGEKLEKLCEVFSVPEEYFFWDPFHLNDRDYYDRQIFELEQYCSQIGLSEGFVAFFTETPSLARLLPISHNDPNIHTSAQILTKSIFHVEDDFGHVTLLRTEHLDLIKRIRDSALPYIIFLTSTQKTDFMIRSLVNKYSNLQLLNGHTKELKTVDYGNLAKTIIADNLSVEHKRDFREEDPLQSSIKHQIDESIYSKRSPTSDQEEIEDSIKKFKAVYEEYFGYPPDLMDSDTYYRWLYQDEIAEHYKDPSSVPLDDILEFATHIEHDKQSEDSACNTETHKEEVNNKEEIFDDGTD